MKLNSFRSFTAITVALLAVCVTQRASVAAKSSTSPPPAGKIQYVADGFIYSMNTDGSSKQQLSPALSDWPTTAPISSKKYSNSRWNLLLGQTGEVFYAYDPVTGAVGSFYGREVFAYRWLNNAWQVVQVTDLTRDGWMPLSQSSGDVNIAWSNDGRDTFLSVRLTSFELTPEGYYIVDHNNYPQSIARIHVSGSELDQLALAGADALIDGLAPRFDVVATEPATSTTYSHIFNGHSWSPDGTKLSVYSDQPDAATGMNLYVYDLVAGTTTPYLIASYGGQSHDWSPNGSAIVMANADGVQLISLVGGGTTLLKKSGSFWETYSTAFWSPDGKWVTYVTLSNNGSRHICRIPAAGGTEVSLTNDFFHIEFPLGWTAE